MVRRGTKSPVEVLSRSSIFAHLGESTYTYTCPCFTILTEHHTQYIDVDEENDYKDMVKKVLERKPKKLTINIEMADVKKSCQKAQVQ